VGTRQGTTGCQDPTVVLEVSEDLAGAMKALAVSYYQAHVLQTKGAQRWMR
jgi:hypothetical protein